LPTIVANFASHGFAFVIIVVVVVVVVVVVTYNSRTDNAR
jgi:hypothetical protein